ncbi:MAG: serine hydrolase [Planctomycetota bacterium]|nr:serine hydrolase [Planctomycetota bacterium]
MRNRLFLALFVSLTPLAAQHLHTPQGKKNVRADLTAFVEHQMRDKQLPAVCLALVSADGTNPEWFWSAAFGTASAVDRSAANRRMASKDTVHRVASVSKLFTATAAMVLAERGELDLDAPVTDYLPEFQPENPFDKPITVRLLLGHRAGLVREGPVGHYFDPEEPDLASTIASLNETRLVHEPGSALKYSNPGPGVVGLVIEKITGKPFEQAVDELVIEPLGLDDSSFAAREDLVERTAHGIMWTYDGRQSPTPPFQFGYGPAANLRSTVVDLADFARSWFPGSTQRVLSPEAQEQMWQPQGGGARGCGLGFFVGEFGGHRSVRHGGAVYGFATTLMALPDEGLAVAVAVTVDFANEISDAIAGRALGLMLAAREGRRLQPPKFPEPVDAAAGRSLVGRWSTGDRWFDLRQRDGELRYTPSSGVDTTLRWNGSVYVGDGRMSVGSPRLRPMPDGSLQGRAGKFFKQPDVAPPPAPEELLPLLGEYGWDHNVLIVYEDGGRLGVLIEWVVREMPERLGPDHYRFRPGMYFGDQLLFERDEEGQVIAAVVGGTRFLRRADPDPDGFRIRAQRMVSELRKVAREASPPAQPDGLRKPDLVNLIGLDPRLKFDVRYAGNRNFLGEPVYERVAASLQRPAAEALVAAQEDLAERGYGLCIFDGYRPWSVTKVFWDATPTEMRHFVADPSKGSRHNRGCAVDLTLYHLDTGEVVTMPSGYDEFTARAYPDWPGGTARQRWHRELLRQTMETHGFTVYEFEWWHFDYRDWRQYPVLDEPLR